MNGNAIHCDHCGAWTRCGNDAARDFYSIDNRYWFCSWDCIMNYAAAKEPVETL